MLFRCHYIFSNIIKNENNNIGEYKENKITYNQTEYYQLRLQLQKVCKIKIQRKKSQCVKEDKERKKWEMTYKEWKVILHAHCPCINLLILFPSLCILYYFYFSYLEEIVLCKSGLQRRSTIAEGKTLRHPPFFRKMKGHKEIRTCACFLSQYII
jgi:hypothetical protein